MFLSRGRIFIRSSGSESDLNTAKLSSGDPDRNNPELHKNCFLGDLVYVDGDRMVLFGWMEKWCPGVKPKCHVLTTH